MGKKNWTGDRRWKVIDYILLCSQEKFRCHWKAYWGFPGCAVVENPTVSAGDAGDVGLIPGWKGPLERKLATHSSILAREIAWTEDPGGLQSMGSHRVGQD